MPPKTPLMEGGGVHVHHPQHPRPLLRCMDAPPTDPGCFWIETQTYCFSQNLLGTRKYGRRRSIVSRKIVFLYNQFWKCTLIHAKKLLIKFPDHRSIMKYFRIGGSRERRVRYFSGSKKSNTGVVLRSLIHTNKLHIQPTYKKNDLLLNNSGARKGTPRGEGV